MTKINECPDPSHNAPDGYSLTLFLQNSLMFLPDERPRKGLIASRPFLPGTGSTDLETIRQFKQLQDRFAAQFESAFPDPMAPKTVVIIPSLTLDQEILSKLKGAVYYEERMLCLLMLLRMPRTRIIYVSSNPVDTGIIDYYLHLLPGVTSFHARERLTLLSCFDNSARPLTEKILERPRLVARIKKSIPLDHLAHIACFNVTEYERRLAVYLQLPVYGCDPDLLFLGTKSMGRILFRESGVPIPPGFENLTDESDIAAALLNLKIKNPGLKKAVIKMNDGFSGEGNAVFSYEGAPSGDALPAWIQRQLRMQLKIIAINMTQAGFMAKFSSMGGIVEEYMEGGIKTSPSVQCRINPLGKIDIISTHDQVLGGEDAQVFLGATFPASPEYAVEIGSLGRKIAEKLKAYGVLGRFSIDFISVGGKEGWKHYAIEINLRKGGTTHPYLMLQYLTDGQYEENTGVYRTANGQPRYYYCTDNLQADHYKGITPYDLVDIAICNELLYDGSSQEGVMFHMIGGLSQFGKIGVVCIGSSPAAAVNLHNKTVQVLDKEGRQ
jgi:hypothetical protein